MFPETAGLPGDDPFFYEKLARREGHRVIAGVDEAGRGPLAGPVVAAGVILPPDTDLSEIRDSKMMTPRARDRAFQAISAQALALSVGVVSREYIDEFNILKASLEAMAQAVKGLDPRPEILLVDGIHPVPLPINQKCLKKGDQISRSISAASVIAKVYRDRIMVSYHRTFPVYGFHRHKGYGTRQHLDALSRYGPCPIHRLTFKGVLKDPERFTVTGKR
ncbi:MAG: ribonuclease HII [Deltaproteobacteria bacterium]|nr:ribonuclease HII [Deltaproteobacteria bacterium]MBW2048647.1 ribonuclease HII [Deltaproteobacteria bacterium]MBW2110690.1 ribonuclease HII [Deltaproteobacteria bacterium]MBW2351907.1 ribonuclease HII [Deltaproteobacteria bacterium]HDZ89120.1 ribonuclease HII [Deltaproteobacteria bacterium]